MEAFEEREIIIIIEYLSKYNNIIIEYLSKIFKSVLTTKMSDGYITK